jgi:AcrR family transcriptional regulator
MKRAEVVADQRRRIRGATVEMVYRDGYRDLTLSDVIAAAGVSRATFYRLYPGDVGLTSREQCFLDAYDDVISRLVGEVRRGERGGRCSRLSSRLSSLTGAFADDPKAAHLALVEIWGAGPGGMRHADRALTRFQTLLRDGIAEGREDLALPALLMHGIVAGVGRVSRSLLVEGRIDELRSIGPELARWAMAFRDARPHHLAWSGGAGAARTSGQRMGPGHAGSERGRMLGAALEIVAAEGPDALTVPRIRRRAGVGRPGFDAQFSDPVDCFLAAVEDRVLRGLRELRHDLTGPDWEAGLRQAMVKLCERLAADPTAARVVFVEALATGAVGVRRRTRLIGLIATCLQGTVPADRRPADLTLEASVGAVWGLIQHHVIAGQAHRLPERAGLMTMLVSAPLRAEGASG